jgi:arylsulfatase A-like enzyme
LIGREAAEIIAGHDKSRPLFLYVPFNAPHTPLQAPRSYIDKYDHMSDRSRRVYAAMVDCMDVAVGQILAALRAHEFPPEETLIFFCSDNGGIARLGSNGELRSGKGTLYEGGVRVPAVMVWKGKLQAGSIVDQPLHIVDLYPTLLKLAGVTPRQHKPLDGKDAWPTIAAGEPTPHEFILHNVTPFHGAIRVGDWKLVRNGHVGANATQAGEDDVVELFNIETDASEQHDLSKTHSEVVQRLKQKLDQLAGEAVKANIPPNRAPRGFRVPEVWGHAD